MGREASSVLWGTVLGVMAGAFSIAGAMAAAGAVVAAVVRAGAVECATGGLIIGSIAGAAGGAIGGWSRARLAALRRSLELRPLPPWRPCSYGSGSGARPWIGWPSSPWFSSVSAAAWRSVTAWRGSLSTPSRPLPGCSDATSTSNLALERTRLAAAASGMIKAYLGGPLSLVVGCLFMRTALYFT